MGKSSASTVLEKTAVFLSSLYGVFRAVQYLGKQLSSSRVPGSPIGLYPKGSSLLHYWIMSLFAGMGPVEAILALPVLYVQ